MKRLLIFFTAGLFMASAILSCTDRSTAGSSGDMSVSAHMSPAEFEKVLLEYGEGAGGYLLDFLQNNPESLSYPFKLLQDSSEISIYTSPDGRLRFYSYDTHLGGTCIAWTTLIQYTNGADTVVGMFCPYSDNRFVVSTNPEQNDMQPDYTEGPCIINGLYEFTRSDGEKLYIVECYMREWSTVGFTTLVALKFNDGKIVKTEGFKTPTREYRDIDYEHEIPGWYFRTLGEGWSWLNSLDSETNTLYIPLVDGMDITDQYLLYQFNGSCLEYKGTGGGFWLHPTIRKFKRLLQLYDSDALRIRLDELSDGKIRYCAWNAGQKMSEKPQITVVGGERDIRPGSIRFRNKGFEYFTPDPESEKPSQVLTVEKRGKVLATHELRDH